MGTNETRSVPGPFSPAARRGLKLAAFLYLSFVVYGSLVPFKFRYYPLEEAWQTFLHIPYLELGIGSRADWVANLLLYMPLGLLLSAAHSSRGGVLPGVFRGVAVWFLCAAVAISVEFTQIFFQPRTVSLNDLVAEALGALAGILLWEWHKERIARGWSRIARGGPAAIRVLLVAYALVYLAFSLFPYDFLLSPSELAWKLSSGMFSWLATTCNGVLHCGGSFLAETLSVAPLGILLAMASPQRRGSTGKALGLGLLLGVLIEGAQFLLASGITQGLSVLSRATGMVLGAALVPWFTERALALMIPKVRILLPVLALPYLLALMALNSWFKAGWVEFDVAGEKLDQVRFLPFYYHYFTSEAVAMKSAIVHFGMYAPIGIACWLWFYPRVERSGAVTAALAAMLTAFVMEFGKLFVPGKHPDPTDIWIAGAAAATAFLIAELVRRWARQAQVSSIPGSQSATQGVVRRPTRRPPDSADALPGKAAVGVQKLAMGENPAPPPDSRREAVSAPPLPAGEGRGEGQLSIHESLPCAAGSSTQIAGFTVRRALALALSGIVVIAAWHFPLKWLLLALLVYGAILWRYPNAWLILVPAMLPVVQLAPWSGWFFFDEFDLFILLTVACVLWKHALPAPAFPRSTGLVLLLLASSYGISLLIGLFPLQPLDANAFSNYLSHYNALRIARGLVWALVLLLLARRAAEEGMDICARFALGSCLGLAGAVAFVAWERAAFPALWDFAAAYRVSGSFASMHTGGAYIEGYLVAAFPFAALAALTAGTWLKRLAATGLLALSLYAVVVTYSRAGVIAFGLSFLALCAALAFLLIRQRSFSLAHGLGVGLLLLVAGGVSAPVLSEGFLKTRLSSSAQDFEVRVRHSREALGMMNEGVGTLLFGMGLGRYPETYFWKSDDRSVATYQFEGEEGNLFLRLGGGSALYLNQAVALEPHRRYSLSLDFRSTGSRAALSVPVCEKWLLDSLRCVWLTARHRGDGQWQRFHESFDSGELSGGPYGLPRPVRLSLANAERGTVVDVDNVRLIDSDGRDLLANGDFSDGHDHWLVASDEHSRWHIWNILLHLYFEQGLYGVAAMIAAMWLALAQTAARIRAGDRNACAFLAALTGFLLVGVFNGLIDEPRMLALFLLLLFIPGISLSRRRFVRAQR